MRDGNLTNCCLKYYLHRLHIVHDAVSVFAIVVIISVFVDDGVLGIATSITIFLVLGAVHVVILDVSYGTNIGNEPQGRRTTQPLSPSYSACLSGHRASTAVFSLPTPQRTPKDD